MDELSSLLDAADWALATPDFGRRVAHRGKVAMEFMPFHRDRCETWPDACKLWLRLPAHPNLLAAVDRHADGSLLLRYAGINWKPPAAEARQFARWGYQVASAFLAITNEIDDEDLLPLLRPFVMIDLADHARLGFLPVDGEGEIAPEVRGRRPRPDERSVVFAIGYAMSQLVDELDDANAWVLKRCFEVNPRKRFHVLEDLRTAWANIAGRIEIRTGKELESWKLVEEALGWIALGESSRARDLLETARGKHDSPIARVALRRANALIEIASAPTPSGPPSPPTPSPPRPDGRCTWPQISQRASELEAMRLFREALHLYSDVRLDGVHDCTLFTAIARCRLALDEHGFAIEAAQHALAADPHHVEALALLARTCLLAHRPADALAAAERWIERRGADGVAHYTRGRALFALARFVEARDAFERAHQLEPKMIEAMLLRREADRALRRVRDQTGTALPLELDVPAHLADVRDALATGNIAGAIALLARSAHDADAAAKLLHARCLAFEQRHDDALAMFARAAELAPEHAHAARLGAAHSLLSLGRADEALAAFDRALADAPRDLDAIEGRSLALRALGRDAEAAAEQARVVAASGGRSELRVGR